MRTRLLPLLVAISMAGSCGRSELDGPFGATGGAAEPSRTGCADGQREAFRDLRRYPDIAGCAGGFGLPGLIRGRSGQCGGTGDDAQNADGARCNAEDLCASGWRVCSGAAEVARASPDGCRGSLDALAGEFYATRQSGPGCNHCATGGDPGCGDQSCRTGCAQTDATNNDVFGCGTTGFAAGPGCSPLDRTSGDLCGLLPPPWSCRHTRATTGEAVTILKTGPAAGGVLCCRAVANELAPTPPW